MPLSLQGWWRDAGEDIFAQEHSHVAACVPNGTHRLFFRAGSTVAKGTNSGVLVIPFTVQN